MPGRILKYERTIIDLDTGQITAELHPFTAEHAAEAHSVLETDGLPIDAAIRLCQKWNGMSERHPGPAYLRFGYSIPFVKKALTDA
jgi:hypothetical protein